MTADDILAKHGIARPECGFCVGHGWLPIVDRALGDMIAAGWDKTLFQVKQKLCGLRIYIGPASRAVRAIIERAEHEAARACEKCGKPHGGPVYPRFGRALCEACK